MLTGRILKGIGGFYYVECSGTIYECKARGLFRKNGIVPSAGDIAEFDMGNEQTGSIINILERKNHLIRPLVSNVDMLIIVASVKDPPPNLFLIDKLTVIAAYKNIKPIIVFNKIDLYDDNPYSDIYRKSGFDVFEMSVKSDSGIDELKSAMLNKFSVFTGVSGVGKSSILNKLLIESKMEIGEISQKLGRGKHTTRHTEIFYSPEGYYIADTPGFSQIETEQYDVISKENLPGCFLEFAQFSTDCKFANCSHSSGKNCGIINALDNGLIEKSRYESYISLYNEVKNSKPWEKQKKDV